MTGLSRISTLERSVLDSSPETAGVGLDVLVEEVHAKRLSIQALQAELGALDRQLELLERTLGPVQAWRHQRDPNPPALTETQGHPAEKT